MRGYGRSTVYSRIEDYALEPIVADMLELADRLGIDRAIWVGHDWGTGVVWNIASHHPERCYGVANLCVPYRTLEMGLDTLVSHIDRDIYPERGIPVRAMGLYPPLLREFRPSDGAMGGQSRQHREDAVPQGRPQARW